MSGSEPEADASTRFGNLCELVAAYLAEGRDSRALALAMACLVYDDDAAFSALSASHEKGPSTDEKLDALADALAMDEDKGELNGERLAAGFQAAPLSLLAWLDNRFATAADGLAAAPAWLSARDVEVIAFGPAELECLGINPALQRFFVFPKYQAHLRAPVQTQTHDPGRFLRYWEVLPEVVDAAQRSRRLVAHSVASGFRDGWRRPGGRHSLLIYLAEFAARPEFDSQWQQGAEWRIWTAKALHNEKAIATAVRRHLRLAASQGADVVVLPELTITPGVLGEMRQALQEIAMQSADQAFCMVVAGSFHALEKNQILNRCVVLDGAGRRVEVNAGGFWGHDKLTRVQLAEAKVMEGNEVGRLLSIVPTPIGTQSIAICLDLAQGAAADAVGWEKVPIRWLWVPSMSAGVRAHQTHASMICLQRQTTVACANQAKADFGSGVALDGASGQSFVWTNEGRSSGAVAAVPGGVPAGDLGKLYALSLEVPAP